MDTDTTSQLRFWHRRGFGRRVMKSQSPYFVISPSHEGSSDGSRRRALARQAGL